MFSRFFPRAAGCFEELASDRPPSASASSRDDPASVRSVIQELSIKLSGPHLCVSASDDDWAKSTVQVISSLQSVIVALEATTRKDTDAQKLRTDAQAKLLTDVLASDLIAKMLNALPKLEFEAQKEVMRLFHQILQTGSLQVIEYVRSHQEVLKLLLHGGGNVDIALPCQMMLRSCTLHSELVACMLESGFAAELIELTHHQAFDISSDAFASLRELLLAHEAVAAAYIEAHFTEFFMSYNKLLQTEEYVAKRQALRLLGEILLNRHFSTVMRRYVGEEQFLQVQMNLMRDNSMAVKVDAFHVFKLFAARPDKQPRVQQILLKNRQRLVKVLESLGKGDDEAFLGDQKAVIKALWTLEALPTRNPPSLNRIGGC